LLKNRKNQKNNGKTRFLNFYPPFGAFFGVRSKSNRHFRIQRVRNIPNRPSTQLLHEMPLALKISVIATSLYGKFLGLKTIITDDLFSCRSYVFENFEIFHSNIRIAKVYRTWIGKCISCILLVKVGVWKLCQKSGMLARQDHLFQISWECKTDWHLLSYGYKHFTKF